MVQLIPYRNAKLTQFVFKQNIREDPLLTALHLPWLYCGRLQCTARSLFYLHWITLHFSAAVTLVSNGEKPLLTTKGGKY